MRTNELKLEIEKLEKRKAEIVSIKPALERAIAAKETELIDTMLTDPTVILVKEKFREWNWLKENLAADAGTVKIFEQRIADFRAALACQN